MPSTDSDVFAHKFQRMVMRYSLSWLAAGCMAGFLIALLLFCPGIGTLLGEWSYGRWIPVHLNFQLYGWSALPLVAVLLKGYVRPGSAGLRQAHLALGAWSLALAFGGASWLAGATSGKLFLDWSGTPRLFFLAALGVLWGVLAWNYGRDWIVPLPGALRSQPVMALKGVLLVGLAAVPWALHHVTERTNYPAIDPGTGGPTGASLLASTLGIVLVIALIPLFLGIARKPKNGPALFWIWLPIAAGYFLLIEHGNSSHRDAQQIGAVALLLCGAPALIAYLRRFEWNKAAGSWLIAVLCWWGALVLMGFTLFLPGILDRLKFTHALIAHADLAMPGLITSLNMLILANLAPPPAEVATAITGRRSYWLWQGALMVQVVLLMGIAFMEAADHGELWKTGGYASLFFTLRLLTGISMATAAALWVWSIWTGKDYEHTFSKRALPQKSGALFD